MNDWFEILTILWFWGLGTAIFFTGFFGTLLIIQARAIIVLGGIIIMSFVVIASYKFAVEK